MLNTSEKPALLSAKKSDHWCGINPVAPAEDRSRSVTLKSGWKLPEQCLLGSGDFLAVPGRVSGMKALSVEKGEGGDS